MKTLTVFVVVLAAVLAEFSYDGYKVYQLIPKSEQEMSLLKLFKNDNNFDFWSPVREIGSPVSIMVTPNSQKLFINILELNGIEYTVLINNVEDTIAAERFAMSIAPKSRKGDITFTDYHRLADIDEYLNRLEKEYPEIVQLESIGHSFQGRELRIMKIGNRLPGKPIIFIEGGIHAREWIAPALVLYIIKELVEKEENRALIKHVDWYVIPVMNPDGYEYSHTNKRLWRKTRSTGKICDGVDANRNFGYHWNLTGASPDECDETYGGPEAFSEKETQAIRKVVTQYKEHIKFYLSVHSYGNYILYPWGYTDKLPDDADELQALGEAATAALKAVHQTSYTVGSNANALYPSAGISTDWVKGEQGINIAYVIELPAGGSAGFDLPPSRILGVCEETWKAVLVFQKYVETNFTEK